MNEQAGLIKATQRIADLFWTMATDEDGAVSWGQSVFYAGANELLIKAIKVTYPDVDADKVQEIMSESGESVAYAVDYWRQCVKRHEWCKDVEITCDGKGYCHGHGVTFAW